MSCAVNPTKPLFCLCGCNRAGTKTVSPDSLSSSCIQKNVQMDFEERAVTGDATEWDFTLSVSYTKLPFCLRPFDNRTFLKVEDDAAKALSFLHFPSSKYISVRFLIQEENIEICRSPEQRFS